MRPSRTFSHAGNIALVFLLTMLIAACDTGNRANSGGQANTTAAPPPTTQAATNQPPDSSEDTVDETSKQEQTHWSYEGDSGPDKWGAINSKYATCSTGQNQSPIDIASFDASSLSDITIKYSPANVSVFNNGHTIEVEYPEGDTGNSITVDGQSYKLAQFHFHTPSEHTIKGQLGVMELHLVHKNTAGQLAVLGMLINSGADNAALAPIWANLPAHEGDKQPVAASFNVSDVLPKQQKVYRYSGSLTTPPCSEGVKWMVMESPIEVSDAQLKAFQAIYAHNNRPVQPLAGRKVTEDSTVKP